MKDKDKAKEIARNNQMNYYEGDIGCGATIKSSEEECYDSAIEMAEWKDKQLYDELFKLSLSSNTHDYMMWTVNKKKELEEQLKNKKS